MLREHFWTPRTLSENDAFLDVVEMLGYIDGSGVASFFRAMGAEIKAGGRSNEHVAFAIGSRELARRGKVIRDAKTEAAANLVLPDAKEWIQDIYKRGLKEWGYVCLYDAAAQQLALEELDDLQCVKDGILHHVLEYNFTKDLIQHKWRMSDFNAPNTAFAPPTNAVRGNAGYLDGVLLRKAFQDILNDPTAYEKSANVTPTPTHVSAGYLEKSIAASGLLTNTFLVWSPEAIDTIYDGGHTYLEGYQGYTWVRLDQLVYNFYELRLFKAEEVGMDEIWKAAQGSKHQAFVSMDPEEAGCWTTSEGIRGFTRDSVIGKRWYEKMDARLAAEKARMDEGS